MHDSFNNSDIHNKKDNIRKIIMQRLKSFDKKSNESELIVKKIRERKDYKEATTILAFYPLSTEPDIKPLLSDSRIALPYIENGNMYFSNKLKMKKSILGFLEPEHEVLSFDNALILVPLIAFDDNLNRLGRGGGFYDRFIKENRRRIYTLGIAYSASRVEEVPIEEFDEKLDEVMYIYKSDIK